MYGLLWVTIVRYRMDQDAYKVFRDALIEAAAATRNQAVSASRFDES
jgi:hypothetical protein